MSATVTNVDGEFLIANGGKLVALDEAEAREVLDKLAALLGQETFPTDETVIKRVGELIREKYPTVISYGVESSDQTPGSGYWLTDVTLAGEVSIDRENDDDFEAFADDVNNDHLCMPRWGSFGDSKHDSMFDVDIATGRIVR